MYIFKGSGSNGKSVLIKIIEDLLGTINVSNTPLSKLEGKFGLQNLEGKLVNISSENELGNKNIDTENIKAITGGDRVEIEKKNKDSYSTELYTRLIISINNEFSFSDTSHGILRRLLFIPFEVKFHELPSDNEHKIEGKMYQDNNLLNELIKEISGIFNMAYEGLQRLRDSNFVYTKSKICEEELEKYKRYIDPIKEFIKYELEIGSELEISKGNISELFKRWQIENTGSYKFVTVSKAASLVEEKLKDIGTFTGEKKVNGVRILIGATSKEGFKSIGMFHTDDDGQTVPLVM